MEKLVVIAKNGCPYTTKTETLLANRKNVTFQYVDGADDVRELQKKYEYYTFPMIFVKKNNVTKFIGGYTTLANMLK